MTTGGKALRFTEDAVRATGRTAAGVLAIGLRADDGVATFDVVEPDGDLLIITQNGYGKRTPLAEYPSHGRHTGGQWTLDHRRLDETGRITAARVVQVQDQVTIITANGVALRTPVAAISQMSRTTRGVRIVTPDGGDTVAAMARLAATVEEAAAMVAESRAKAESQASQEEREPMAVEESLV